MRRYLTPPLFFLSVFTAPYLILLAKYGVFLQVDSYVLWVFAFTWAQAAASAALSLAVGLALVPAYVRFTWVKPVALVPFFAPALSTVDALIRLHGDFMYGPWGIVVAHAAYYGPYVALVVESNLRSIPADSLEVADLYVRRAATRLRIVFAELRPAVLYSFFTVFIFSFLSFTTPLLLGGRYPTLELLVYIYATSFASTDLVASLVLLGLLSSAVLALPLLRIPAPPPAEPAPRTPAVGAGPTAFSLGVALYFFAVAFYIFSPLLEPRGVDAVVQPLFNSFAVALTASAAVLLVVLAFLVSDSVGSRLPALTYVVTVSLSKSLFALGFFHMAQPLYGTLLILMAAHSVVIAPLAYSLVKPTWEKIRIDTREACVLYLGPLKCVTRIISEALGPTLVQTWLVALASSLSETTLALMLTTGGAATLSAEAVRLLTSRAPDLIEMGHFYSAVLALLVLVLLAASRLIKPRPYSI